jgi:hypothetical protein
MADKDKPETKGEKPEGREFMAEALRRFRLAEEAEAENRKDALDDLRFYAGEQWPDDVKTSRSLEGRPCLVMNRLPEFVSLVVNEIKQQKPGVEVNPVGSGSDVETAEVLEGVIRHIEDRSRAEEAYDYAFKYAMICGWGYWRIATRYKKGSSGHQEIEIKRVANPFAVYLDPFSQEPDREDAKWGFVVEDLSKEEYRRRFPKSELASLLHFNTVGNDAPGWVTEKGVRVAEYWHVDEDEDERKVVCSIINGMEVIEEYDWPGRTIPIVAVIADEMDVNGRRRVSGMVRSAKDAQRQYNFMASAATEAIALAPKAPFIGVEGAFENHEDQWRQANQRNFAYLEYKAISVAGQPAPPPQRNSVEPPIQAMMMMVQQADNDLKATTGLYDASHGAVGPEQSARAILARQNQGGVSTLGYTTALARAIQRTGRILVDIIPKIYDAPRIERIVAPDGTVRAVGLHNSQVSGLGADEAHEAIIEAEEEAVEKIFDLGVGEYDVTISLGPSYQSKRQEAVASIMTLVNSYPNIIPIAGDILIRNMDWPGSQEIAERLQRMLPPQLQPATGDPRALVAQLQQQLQAMAAMNQQLTQRLEAATDTILTRRIEAESRERIAEMQANTNVVVAELKARTASAQADAAQEIALVKEWHKTAHETALATVKQ